MRWGVLLPTFDPLRSGDPSLLADAARAAERLGFDGAWAGDHLACPAPVLDAPACLAAAAAVTERIALGFSVLLLGLRAPAWAAKQIATLDVLSGGRLRVGVGAGGEFPQEFAAAGVPRGERGARLDAALEALPDLLTGGALEPALDRVPPLYVGGRSDAALRRAARHADAWLSMWMTPRALAAAAERLGELAAGRGRERPALALLAGVRVGDDAAALRRDAERHLRGQYGLGLDAVGRWTLLGDRDAIAERLHGYAEAGVGEIVLMPLGPDPLTQYERLAAALPQTTGGPA